MQIINNIMFPINIGQYPISEKIDALRARKPMRTPVFLHKVGYEGVYISQTCYPGAGFCSIT